METELREYLGRNWGWLLLRGVVALLFGVFALARPGITLAALVFTWGAYAIADGIFALAAGFQMRGAGGRPLWSWLLMGVVGIGAGVGTFMVPGITALVLLTAIAAWAIGVGVLQIAAAVRLRKVIEGEWALGLSGLLSVVFGVLALAHPGAGALSVLWLIAAYAITSGFTLITAGVRVKSFAAGKLAHA
ncbi:MAG TPA: HdeD family acid-resistance protein [Polyangia bacterium]|nr:HdeD family acid-resistance protein [Polyangia bacterium]